eukprot:g4078.t1
MSTKLPNPPSSPMVSTSPPTPELPPIPELPMSALARTNSDKAYEKLYAPISSSLKRVESLMTTIEKQAQKSPNEAHEKRNTSLKGKDEEITVLKTKLAAKDDKIAALQAQLAATEQALRSERTTLLLLRRRTRTAQKDRKNWGAIIETAKQALLAGAKQTKKLENELRASNLAKIAAEKQCESERIILNSVREELHWLKSRASHVSSSPEVKSTSRSVSPSLTRSQELTTSSYERDYSETKTFENERKYRVSSWATEVAKWAGKNKR